MSMDDGLQNPDKQSLIDGNEWDVIEREYKLATPDERDLRVFLADKDLRINGINLKRPRRKSSQMRVLTGIEGVDVYILDDPQYGVIRVKLKVLLPSDDGVLLNRHERIVPLDKAVFIGLGLSSDAAEYLSRACATRDNSIIRADGLVLTPHLVRERIMRRAILWRLAAQFELIADHCFIPGIEGTPLNQVEIEMDGIRAEPGQQIRDGAIASAYAAMHAAILSGFAERGVALSSDTRTKSSWARDLINRY